MTYRPIADLVAQLHHLQVQLSVTASAAPGAENLPRLRCSAPAGSLTPALRQELADRKAELLAYLHPTQGTDSPPACLPLSFAQQRLWFLAQLAPDNPFYNVPAALRLTGCLDQTALERSLQTIVARHAVLRSRFITRADQPVQVIEPERRIELVVVNLPAVAPADRPRLSQQLALQEAQRPFNLTTDSLVRLTLVQFDPTESVLLLTLHHIVADGWSLGVLLGELATCYSALVQGRSPVLPTLPMQYHDFALWQRHWLQGEILEKQLAYWRRQLEDLPVLQLPGDRPRPAVQTYRGATCPLQISPALTVALQSLSQRSGVSLFMTLLAAFATLLYRYTGQVDLAIGTPIANRHRSQLEGLIGFFVNSLVLRTDLSGDPGFRELLERVRQVALAAYEHQDLPFEKLVEELDPDRDLSRNPLFQVAFALQNAPMQTFQLPGLTLEPTPLNSESARFDLEVHLWEPDHGLRSLWQSEAGLSGFICYSTDLFDSDRIARLVGHFQTLLAAIVAQPEARLSELSLLTLEEQQQILRGWNQPSEAPLGSSAKQPYFHQIVETWGKTCPMAIALVTEQGSVTYADLNQHAAHLARVLRQRGIRPGALVGLCVDRSVDLVIGMLGIFQAGAAYVPLNPSYPLERLDFIIQDTQLQLVLTQSWLVDILPPSPAQLCLDRPLPAAPSGSQPESTIPADRLAYVIYTSGSTGVPKGVLISQGSLSNLVAAQGQLFRPSSHRVLQFSSLSFDASIFEIVLALAWGGTLYIPPRSAQLPGMALVQFFQANAITHALLTPSVLAVLPTAPLPALQVLITGGEACSTPVLDRWAVGRRFFNAYGPTETTIWATVAELSVGDNPRTIGCPVLHTQVYILDVQLRPVPVGMPGELYIAGVGLAQGYLNRPELTAERFVASPFDPASRLYKTGDRGQYRPDGTIEFLGRVDTQVKIRGVRVELGEIEATLQSHPAIATAVAIAPGQSTQEARLVACFSLNREYQQAILATLEAEQIGHWQSLYNQTYQTEKAAPDFNITGWHSSYTGEPIPPEQMQEWVGDRVQQILALKPKRVLEIGCGTGLLLFPIAPHCQQYVGTDFSAVSLASLQTQLEVRDLSQVTLLHRSATDFQGIDLASFDVVILNSIVQYFPSQTYLIQVLTAALQAVAPGGVIFVGDIRSLPLLPAFHSWMKFFQADPGMACDQLQAEIARSLFEEPELVIDPRFFYQLPDRFDTLSQVQVRLTRGRSQNEMTQFRYNVLLYTGPPEPSPARPLPPDHDWQRNPLTIAAVKQYLLEQQPEIYLISGMTNSRIVAPLLLLGWLGGKTPGKTVGRLRERLKHTTIAAIDPQDWWDLEAQLPYTIEITWSISGERGAYDLLLLRRGAEASHRSLVAHWHAAHGRAAGGSGVNLSDLANWPLQGNVARQLIPELRQYLRQTLPDYMVPSIFVPLDTLPLTTHGKVDRGRLTSQFTACLPPSQADRPGVNPGSFPATPVEVTLSEIWKELLRVQQLGPGDNFFELGGHSLLATQMTSRVRDALGLELPLQKIFESPTIAQLAATIATLQTTTAEAKVPPLVRLDRSAFRHPRSALSRDAEGVSLLNSPPPTSPPVPSLMPGRSPLVPLTLGGSKPPFFCVHPMFGVVFPYLELAHHLDGDRSFYGLQPAGLDGQSPPLTQIEAMAAYYLQAIRAVQPQGPYYLGGWSFGGLVAFEMAHQLTQAGQQIGLLAILDTPAPTTSLSVCQSLKFLLGTALWSVLPFLLDYGNLATQQLQSRLGWLARWQWSTLIRLLPEESRLQLLEESVVRSLLPIIYANSRASYGYRPRPYTGKVTLFKAAEQPEALQQEPTLGWSTLVDDIQLHQVPGNHLSLLKQPQVQTLAAQLRQCLT